MIYEYCLVSKQKIIPYATEYEIKDGIIPYSNSHEDLDLALLLINRQIGDETAEIFYDRNTFYLSSEARGWAECLRSVSLRRIRHLSLSLDKAEFSLEQSIKTFENCLQDASLASLEQADLAKFIHDERIRRLFREWVWLSNMIVRLNLKSLEIDVRHLVCPQGCCRLVKEYWGGGEWRNFRCHGSSFTVHMHRHDDSVECVSCSKGFKWFEVEGLAEMQIKVIGIQDEDEWKFLHSLGFGCEACPVQGGILNLQACPGSWMPDYSPELV